MWGTACEETNQLASGILDFAVMQGIELPPDDSLCREFAREVLVPLPQDGPFTLRLADVAGWLRTKKGPPC